MERAEGTVHPGLRHAGSGHRQRTFGRRGRTGCRQSGDFRVFLGNYPGTHRWERGRTPGCGAGGGAQPDGVERGDRGRLEFTDRPVRRPGFGFYQLAAWQPLTINFQSAGAGSVGCWGTDHGVSFGGWRIELAGGSGIAGDLPDPCVNLLTDSWMSWLKRNGST